MDALSNADVLVSAARSVLIQTGEHEAAEALRGLEVFSLRDAALALNVLEVLKLTDEDARMACNAAVEVLNQVLVGGSSVYQSVPPAPRAA